MPEQGTPNPVVEFSLNVMEKGIPPVVESKTFRKQGEFMVRPVDYVYNPKAGYVLEIQHTGWDRDGVFEDPGKHYHTFKLAMVSGKDDYLIIEYEPPEKATPEAKKNLEEAVIVWNQRRGFDPNTKR